MASLLNLFARTHGLIKIRPTVRVSDNYTLSLVYTPGVGHVCKVIEKDPDLLYDLCITGRSIALITDGSGFYLFYNISFRLWSSWYWWVNPQSGISKCTL